MASADRPARAGVSPLADVARNHQFVLVGTASLTRAVDGVAFDDFVFETTALVNDGSTLERGTNTAGVTLAVASVPWPAMPIDWISLQSRDGTDHLRIVDEMAPVGHDVFDQAFSVDADDPSTFRQIFRTSLREWIVDFDARHGPLTIIFDGQSTDRRDRDEHESTIFVAREVLGDDAFAETLTIAATFADHVLSTLDG